MIGIVVHLPPAVETYFLSTPLEVMAAQALLIFGWFPIFGVLVWGMTHVWLAFKQNKYAEHLHWNLLEVKVPQGSIQTPKGMENFFNNLAGVKSGITWREKWLLGKFQAQFSFELVSNGGDIKFMVRCLDKYRDLVEAMLYAQYPEAQIGDAEDYVGAIPRTYPNEEGYDVFGAEMMLTKPAYLPIRTFDDFEHQGEKDARFKDPLLPMLELMGKMRAGEHFWIQILISPMEDYGWMKEGIKFLNSIMGKEEKKPAPSMTQQLGSTLASLPMEAMAQLTGIGASPTETKKADDFRMFKLTPAEKIQIDSVAEKISKIGWYTKIRYVYGAKKKMFRKGMMASGMKGLFQPFNSQLLNSFGAHGPSVPKDDYIWQAWTMKAKQRKLVKFYQTRDFGAGATPSVLNSEELATLYHFPASDARTPVLTALGARRAEAPTSLPLANPEDPDLADWKQTYGKEKEPEIGLSEPAPHALPTPVAPTAPAGAVPEPGRPAPLPPGLDLSSEPIKNPGEAPGNLPL